MRLGSVQESTRNIKSERELSSQSHYERQSKLAAGNDYRMPVRKIMFELQSSAPHIDMFKAAFPLGCMLGSAIAITASPVLSQSRELSAP